MNDRQCYHNKLKIISSPRNSHSEQGSSSALASREDKALGSSISTKQESKGMVSIQTLPFAAKQQIARTRHKMYGQVPLQTRARMS